MRRIALIACCCFSAATLDLNQTTAPARAEQVVAGVERLADQFLTEYAARYPTSATELGLHDHDGEIEDLSPAGRAREVAWLRGWERRLSDFPEKGLAQQDAADLQLLRHEVGRRLFELTEHQAHRRRPNLYLRLCARSVYAIMKRSFAPPEVRLRSLASRMEKIPPLLKGAPAQLDRMAPVAVDIALSELTGTARFLDEDVGRAFASVADPAMQARLGKARAAVKAAVGAYGEFLKKDGKARATTPFALGEELFRKKIYWDEMIDTPVDRLQQRGEDTLQRLVRQFEQTARQIDAKKSPAEVQDAVLRDHPPADRLVPEVQSRVAALRKFIVDRQIATIPAEVLPRVQETPPFMRATSLASMDMPGPFERGASEAYYNITPPEDSWTADQKEDFLRGAFARPLIDVVTIHEAFPGHYVQYLWLARTSKVRKFIGVASNSEGWAHYTEQMALDEGFGAGDPRLRLMQLQDALLRAARYVAAIRLHARGMTFDEAVAFFQKPGYQTKKVAELEVRRGTQDPSYLCYTWGKLEIYDIRDAYQKKLGKDFTLRRFHDAFLAQGRAPLPMVRQALLADR